MFLYAIWKNEHTGQKTLVNMVNLARVTKASFQQQYCGLGARRRYSFQHGVPSNKALNGLACVARNVYRCTYSTYCSSTSRKVSLHENGMPSLPHTQSRMCRGTASTSFLSWKSCPEGDRFCHRNASVRSRRESSCSCSCSWRSLNTVGCQRS